MITSSRRAATSLSLRLESLSVMKDPVPFDDFYMALGRATAHWVGVEDALQGVFSRSVSCAVCGLDHTNVDATFVLGNIFYATTNFRARMSMIEMVLLRMVQSDEIMKEWKAIRNRLGDLYNKRSILAHGTIWGNADGASALGSSMFQGNPTYMEYRQVVDLTNAFKLAQERVSNFAGMISAHLVHPHGPRAARTRGGFVARDSKSAQ